MGKTSSEKRFRDLFNTKRGSIILGVMFFCLIAFGIGQTLTFFVLILASTPFVVVFWATVGHKVIHFIKWIRLRSTLKCSATKNISTNIKTKQEEETRNYLNKI